MAANDSAKYLEIQLKLFEAWVDACPSSVPVRVSDPEYRKKYIAHLAECATACAFDETAKKISADMSQAMANLKWTYIDGKTKCAMNTFVPLLQTVLASTEHSYSEVMMRQYTPCPDVSDPAILRRVSYSLFVQGWLPYLDEQTAEILLRKTGLAQEYLSAESHPSMQLTCGHCNSTVPVFPGANQCVCETCGHKLAVEQGISCDGCGTHLAIDKNTADFLCPHCRRKIERVGAQWPGVFSVGT